MTSPAARDACPCGSETPYARCCGRPDGRGLTKAALERWAAQRGVLEHLDVRAGAIIPALPQRLGPLPRWLRQELTVGVLLAPEGLLPIAASGVGVALSAMREAGWRWLLREVEIVDEGRELAVRKPARPAEPVLAALHDRLRVLRDEVRRTASPRATSGLAHCTLHLDPEARRAVFVEHRATSAAESSRMVRPTVLLPLAASGEEPPAVPGCTCERDAPCMHVLAALDLVLRQLSDPAHAATWQDMARALATPDWARALAAFDAVHRASRVEAPRSGAVRYSFRIRDQRAYGGIEVSALRHRRKKDGTYGGGSRIRPGQLRDGPGPCGAEDAAALRKLGFLGGRSYHYGYGDVTFRPRDLRALAGHPRVFVDADDVPVEVRAATLGLAVRPVEGGGAELAFTAAGEDLPFESVTGALASLEPDGTFLHVDRRRRLCLAVEVTSPETTSAVVAALGRHGRHFPPEAESDLLDGIGRLQELLPVEVPEALEGNEVPPSSRHVLRLAPLERGVSLRLLVRPLDGAPAQVPGAGPPRLFAVHTGGRVFVRRDLEAELRAAEGLLAALPLAPGEGWASFEWAVGDDAAALALVEHLRTAELPGVTVEWDGPPPRVLRATSARGLRVEVRDRNDWFGLDGEVELDGQKVKLALLLDALRERRTVVRLSGGAWLAIAGQLADRLAPLARLSSTVGDDVEIGPSALGALDDLARDGATLDARGAFARLHARMREASRRTAKVPRAFRGKLRRYQVEGFRWLDRLASWGAGAVLADDMGLGKTLQALALLCRRSSIGPALVVAPTSVCANWVAEARRFTPSLNVKLFRDGDRAAALEALGPGDVLVVSYGLLVLDLKRFRGKRFATLVLDEAQAVKNAATRRARAARELDAEFRVALSGTPVENHLGELWSVYRIVFPGLLGSWELFRSRFAQPIERDGDLAARRALSAALRPFLLRRMKAEVAPELPPRTELLSVVTLSPGERRLYEQARLAAVARLAGEETRVRPEQRRFQILAAITELRLLACHPRLHDPGTALPSSKLARFLELAAELVEGGHRALVFSQFTSHLALVREALAAAGTTFLYLDGQTPPAERERLVARFQAGEADLFLVSLKAGGTGLNLTGADYVVHLDPWWNPAVEDQATDRAHRIGQQRPVTVYRLVSEGTIEEAIVRLHDRKRELVSGVLDGMDVAGKLSPDELMALVREGPHDPDASDAARRDAAVLAESEALAPAGAETPLAGRGGAARASAAAPSRTAEQAEALTARFRQHLQHHLERGYLGSQGTVRAYARAAARFLRHLSSDGVDLSSPSHLDTSALVPAYLEALRSGAIEASASEPLVARSALGELTRFLAAEPDLAMVAGAARVRARSDLAAAVQGTLERLRARR